MLACESHDSIPLILKQYFITFSNKKSLYISDTNTGVLWIQGIFETCIFGKKKCEVEFFGQLQYFH